MRIQDLRDPGWFGWAVFILAGMFFVAGCGNDDKGPGSGSSGGNGIWVTYQGVTHPVDVSVQTANNRIDEEEIWLTLVASGFAKDSSIDKDNAEEDFWNTVVLVTLKLQAGIHENGSIASAPYTLEEDSWSSNPSHATIHLEGGVAGLPNNLESVSGTLTFDTIKYEGKDIAGDGDSVLELTSTAKIHHLELSFDGNFRSTGDEDGPLYEVSGKVIYKK